MDKSKELPILLKVVEEKYLQSTLSGNIFFGSLDLYKSAENQQGDKVIGDANDDIAKLLKGKEEFTGNKCRIILFDKNELMSRLEDIEVECGPVRYYDTTDVKEFLELVGISPYFLKSQVYQYQREYRIAKRLKENKKGEVVSLNVTNIGKPITLSELANYILVYNVGLLQVSKLVKWVTEKK